ncbi:hypothetical protein B296_00003158 [Ensete ventricosum]|uniref:Uncharacterized protein n=1 Tax=Ensete ventricosum TaxID=4639 RepID=A0A427AWU2_ENSVE|nr:hypothetical protein B296_00003158 [Ensete ventricosum]
MLTCHPGNRHGEAARAEGCVEGRCRASIFCRVSSHYSRDFVGLPSSQNVQEVPAKVTMKQPVEVLAKRHSMRELCQTSIGDKDEGYHALFMTDLSVGDPDRRLLRPNGELPTSKLRWSVKGRNSRRLLVRGHVMEDKLLKSIRDMEVLKAEMPSKIISDDKESLDCKMGLQGTKQGTQVCLDSTLLKKVKVLPQQFIGGLLFKVVNPKGGVDHLRRQDCFGAESEVER